MSSSRPDITMVVSVGERRFRVKVVANGSLWVASVTERRADHHNEMWELQHAVRTVHPDEALHGVIDHVLWMTGLAEAALAGLAAESVDPGAKLAKVKTMVDQGLITEDDYQAVKAKVLASL